MSRLHKKIIIGIAANGEESAQVVLKEKPLNELELCNKFGVSKDSAIEVVLSRRLEIMKVSLSRSLSLLKGKQELLSEEEVPRVLLGTEEVRGVRVARGE